MARLSVEINPKNSADIMLAISKIKGVKSVESVDGDIETHKDRAAYVRALEKLKNDDRAAFETLHKKFYGK